MIHLGKGVVVATSDAGLRERLGASLSDMRWSVREAKGGAEALAYFEEQVPEALIVDLWLPDLEVSALISEIGQLYPTTDILRVDGTAALQGHRSAHRSELLHVVREITNSSGDTSKDRSVHPAGAIMPRQAGSSRIKGVWAESSHASAQAINHPPESSSPIRVISDANSKSNQFEIPGLVGQSAAMVQLCQMIRLVAPHSARVLIEGQTGTGKELVAKALHTLSGRAKRPFVVLNCAAIPESLLEAELFGHTRGAFTGAVQSRVGRIEAANGGTLFLDEIGEMPLSLQSKLLRFLENGELQRVGDNEAVRVDVRVLAATHQRLEERVAEGKFRLDLFHRLAVFPIAVPSLQERLEDVPALAEHFLANLALDTPRKYLSIEATEKLLTHAWPGNVRELANVLQRAVILVGDEPVIGPAHILLRHSRS